ncbi:MAG: endopeptidase La [Oscillospiraceae bacterium]|nr:endopeptidase La [Oscillospiraceae bacterium]
MAETQKKALRQEILPVIVIRGLVLYPQTVLHFDVVRPQSIAALNLAMETDRRVMLVAQKDLADEIPPLKNCYRVGVVATIKQILRTSKESVRILIEGSYRAKVTEQITDLPAIQALVTEHPLRRIPASRGVLCAALMRKTKELFGTYTRLAPQMPKEMLSNVMNAEDPVYLVEYIAGTIPLHYETKQAILEESGVVARLEMLVETLENENNILSVEQDLYNKVKENIDRNQREYFLREQQKVIAAELGEDESVQDDANHFADQIYALELPAEIEEKLIKEASRLYRMPENSHEATVIRTYLETVLELPWKTSSKESLDLQKAATILDRDHYGLEKVKERILELISVRMLAPDIKSQIICLVGPPGVGKTSVAQSLAKSLGRKYARISLGGVRDESDIRGHRKTYIGAMPGRIINALIQAGTNNPLILLDEIDKMGNDFRGDPASAMLEVLDGEQNNAFRDHYIEVPFDLSHVLFVTTANTTDTIPAPLLDRMEIIELPSYTRIEKYHIAKKHLVPKQIKRHGLTGKNIRFADSAIYSLIDHYTREAGVRKLEREIGAICRKEARKFVSGETKRLTVDPVVLEQMLGIKRYRPEQIFEQDLVGVVNGLAWTSVGGELLQIEVSVLDGTGKIELTGSLGDVMKESARTALSFVRSIAKDYNIPADFHKTKDIHIHAPEGAVPKDGPSAGITMATALLSALTGIPVRRDVAMTGEITLRGRVLAIGGLKEKVMAAARAGVGTVIIPKDNYPDWTEIDKDVTQNLECCPVDSATDVLRIALAAPTQEQPTYLPVTESRYSGETAGA